MIERAAQGAHRLPALVARGRRVREMLKRADHGVFDTVGDRDALAILEDQNRARLPELVPVRMGRLAQSPFAFYRGSAAVMAHDLADGRRTGIDVVLCGDAHIANFGFYASPERSSSPTSTTSTRRPSGRGSGTSNGSRPAWCSAAARRD